MNARVAVILALSGWILVSRGFSAWLLVDQPARALEPGVEIGVRDGGLVVNGIRPRDLSGQPTPAALAGLRVGDRMRAIVGSDGTRFDLESLTSAGEALRHVAADDRWTLVVTRDTGGAGSELSLDMRHTRRGSTALLLNLMATLVLPLVSVGTALLITFLRPGDEVAFLAALLFLAFSSIFGAEYWLLPGGVREITAVVQTGLASLFAYVFFRFFMVFPGPSPLDRRIPALKHVLLVPALCIGLVSIGLALTALRSLQAAQHLAEAVGGRWATGAYEVVTLGLLGLGFVSLGSQYVAARTPGDRRRVGILLAGVLGGLGPFLLAIAVFWLTGAEIVPLWVIVLLVPTLLLFPLSFVYAVVRHRVLGVPVIVRRGVRYALVSRGFLAGEVVAVFLALYFGVGPLLAAQFPGAGSGAIAATNAVATLAAVAGVDRLNRRLRPVLDRRFFRDPYNAQAVLTDLGVAMKAHATDPHRLAQVVVEHVSAALHAATAEAVVDTRRAPAERIRHVAPGGATDRPPRVFACEGWVTRDPLSGHLRRDPGRPESLTLSPRGPLLSAATAAPAAGVPTFELDPTDPRGWTRQLERAAPHAASDDREFEQLVRRQARLIAPLATQDAVLGWLLLGDRLSEEAYTPDDRALVGAVAQQAAIAFDYATLIGQVAAQEALRRELDIARTVQAGLFPQRRPSIPTLDYDGLCRTAQEVGGDYYDFLEVGGGRLGLAIGDISGKGVSAALLMASLQALLRSRAPHATTGLAALMLDINHLMLASTDPSKFATLFYSVYDPATGILTYANAGHNPPMLVRAGSGAVARLAPTGPALGLMANVRFAEASERLAPGDLLVMFTDGVSEAMNADRDEYGEERLLDCLMRHRDLGATALCEGILADVGRFVGGAQPHDDITLVVVRAA